MYRYAQENAVMLTSLQGNVSVLLLINDGKQCQANGHASMYVTRIVEDTPSQVRKVCITACGMFTHLHTFAHDSAHI